MYYWYDPERGKAWPFDGHYGGDEKLTKLVDPSVVPPEFFCFWDPPVRLLKFRRNTDGSYDQWIWHNCEWVWGDNVSAATAVGYFSDPATLVAY